MIDHWANFLYNEKFDPARVSESDMLKLVSLCEKLATIQGPKIKEHRLKLESRRLVCHTAMEMGIDLLAIKHKVTGKRLIGRGLLDMWNVVYKEKYGDNFGTAGSSEAARRDVKIDLREQARAARAKQFKVTDHHSSKCVYCDHECWTVLQEEEHMEICNGSTPAF